MSAITTELIEDGEKRDMRGRRVTPASRRAELVREYRASGLTQAAFARREGVRNSTFAHWVLQSTKAEAARSSIQFAQVRLPVPPTQSICASLEVHFPDGTLLRGNSATELAVLVRALRS